MLLDCEDAALMYPHKVNCLFGPTAALFQQWAELIILLHLRHSLRCSKEVLTSFPRK